MYVNQGLPFHSTIVQREFTHIAYALLFRRLSDVFVDIKQFFFEKLKGKKLKALFM